MNVALPIIVSKEHKVLAVPFSEAVSNLFPAANKVTLEGNDYNLVPHHPTEAFMLRKLGFTVPAPILTHYEWPGMFKPFEAQRQTCALLTMNHRGYVLNSMGTGKTSAALWAWDYLNKCGLTRKLLVVAPLSTLKFTWAREVFSTLPHRKAVVVHAATRAKRIELLKSDADIFIINHDGAKLLHDEIIARGDIDTIVIDELATYRNAKSDRTKSMKKLATHSQWVWGMTGSPMPKSPTDVWAQVSIVTPDRVEKYFSHFRDKLMVKINQFKYAPRPNAVAMAYETMQPAVRFTLDDVVELPELIVRTLDIDMGKTQASIYKKLAAQCFAAVGNHEITAANAGAVMMKLLQVSTGWVYDSERATVSLDNGERVKAMIDAINSTDQKVLVFTPFVHSLDGISAALAKEDIEHACVSGATPINERSEIFNLFQNTDKYKVIVAHPQCLAHGITLTNAATIIWFAPVTSLEIYEQANARIRRVGQKFKQLVLHLQGTPVEKRIYKLLQNNQQVQDAFLDMFAEATNENPIT